MAAKVRARRTQLTLVPQQFLGLPHRPPFVFVRELLASTPGQFAECVALFEASDPIFAGHFPGNPIVPGVILTEAMAQTAGIAAASGYGESERPVFLLSGIRAMKFLRPVRPGERIKLKAEKLAQVGQLVQFQVAATIDDEPVAEGQLVLTVARP